MPSLINTFSIRSLSPHSLSCRVRDLCQLRSSALGLVGRDDWRLPLLGVLAGSRVTSGGSGFEFDNAMGTDQDSGELAPLGIKKRRKLSITRDRGRGSQESN